MSQTPVPFTSFVGVDLHKSTVSLHAVDPAGKTIAALTCHTRCVDRIEQWLAALPRPSRLAVEAVGFVEWFIDRFRPCVDRMDIADATELASRRGKRRKTDRKDAADIAARQESAGRTQSGHITKAGSPTLRWAVCKAAVTLCRSDARQEAIRQRLIQRTGKPKANVAMGRRLLRILFAMVRDGALYQGQEPTGHEKAANKARPRKLSNRRTAA